MLAEFGRIFPGRIASFDTKLIGTHETTFVESTREEIATGNYILVPFNGLLECVVIAPVTREGVAEYYASKRVPAAIYTALIRI